LRQRCERDGLPTDDATIARYFRLHLHRGIGYLFGDGEVNSIEGLLRLVDHGASGRPVSRRAA
jgi:DNA sulfur modification protein DndE